MHKHCGRCNRSYDDAVDISVCPHDFIDLSAADVIPVNYAMDCVDELIREFTVELMVDDICNAIPQWKRYGES